MEDKQFYVGQKAFIEKDGYVLVLNDPVEGLDFPGGKIQEGEEKDLISALEREVREETNLKIEVGEPFAVWYNKFPAGHRNAGKEIYLVNFRCRYVLGDVRLSSEHDKYRWVNKDNFKEVDDGSDYFRALEKYFSMK